MKKFIVAAITVLILNTIILYENCQSQWVNYNFPYNGIAYTLGFYDASKLISFGHGFFPYGERIYYTTNLGVSWVQAFYPAELRAIADVQFINATTVYACGAENVIGKNYFPMNDFANYPKSLRDKYLREGKREFFSEYKGAFVKSTNGGLNWVRGCVFDTLAGYVMDIHFFDLNTGYALIDSNSYGRTRFYKTTNGGANWQFVSRIDTAMVESMHFFDMNTGVANGFSNGGRIYRTTNAGVNWSISVMPSQVDCMTFLNSTTGIAIGIKEDASASNIYRTTNGGINWVLSGTIAGSRQLHNMKTLAGTGTAFAVGNYWNDTIGSGRIITMKTTNYGVNWVMKEFNPYISTNGIALIDANNFFIGGGDFIGVPAQVLKSTNGGNVFVNQIGTEVPSAYALGQNYPNPFNPISNIKYKISKSSNVRITVYDVRGKEIEILVNEKHSPGEYQVSFDGSGLNSGVYFYRMETDGFIETKPMVLIK